MGVGCPFGLLFGHSKSDSPKAPTSNKKPTPQLTITLNKRKKPPTNLVANLLLSTLLKVPCCIAENTEIFAEDRRDEGKTIYTLQSVFIFKTFYLSTFSLPHSHK
jgi:hypothetical protein